MKTSLWDPKLSQLWFLRLLLFRGDKCPSKTWVVLLDPEETLELRLPLEEDEVSVCKDSLLAENKRHHLDPIADPGWNERMHV